MKNSVRWPSVIVCAAPSPLQLFSLRPALSALPSAGGGIKPCRFIALQSRAALPIAGKFKPCHREEEANFSWTSSVFLEIGRGLVNLVHHALSSPGFYCFRDRVSRSPDSPKCDFCFLFVEGYMQARLYITGMGRKGKKEGYPLCSFRIKSNRACRSFINPRSLPAIPFSDLYSHPVDNNRRRKILWKNLIELSNPIVQSKWNRGNWLSIVLFCVILNDLIDSN